MNDEELKKKIIRFNRWVLLIAAFLIVGGFALAIIKDNDWWALAGCWMLALFFSLCIWEGSHRIGNSSGGLVVGLTFFSSIWLSNTSYYLFNFLYGKDLRRLQLEKCILS